MEQKYEYVPAFVKVNENLSSVSRALDLNALGSSELTTVCGISSRLIHVTVVPAATVKVTGEKLKLSILTSTVCSWPCCVVEPKYPEPADNKATALNSENVNTVMHKHVRIISLISKPDTPPVLRPNSLCSHYSFQGRGSRIDFHCDVRRGAGNFPVSYTVFTTRIRVNPAAIHVVPVAKNGICLV